MDEKISYIKDIVHLGYYGGALKTHPG